MTSKYWLVISDSDLEQSERYLKDVQVRAFWTKEKAEEYALADSKASTKLGYFKKNHVMSSECHTEKIRGHREAKLVDDFYD